MLDALRFHVTGLAPMFAQYGIAGSLILGCLAFAYLSPIFKKTALWVASGIALWLVAYSMGVNDGSHRVRSQWSIALDNEADAGEADRVDAERTVRAEPPDVVRRDPQNRDNWKR